MAKRAAAFALAWLAIAADVLYGGPISHVDVWLAERVALSPYSGLGLAARFWANLHTDTAVLAYTTLFVVLLLRRNAWEWAARVSVAVPGAMLLNGVLRVAVQRSRPVLDNPVLALNTYAFPSAHVAAASGFYALLAAYLAWRFPARRNLVFAAAALAVLLVALSRMALADHYFGDALGALACTGAWLAICLGSVHAPRAVHPR